MNILKPCVAAIAVACLLASTSRVDAQDHDHEKMEMPTFGIAVLTPTQGNKVRGVLRLTQQGDELRIQGRVNNLTPGEHGFHIHQFGDARGPDGMATGGHYNPGGHDHGALGAKSHAGDLGNITANADGVAQVNIRTTNTKLHFVLGRAFIVHADKDDLTTQPTGDAGARVAVGVIGIGNPEFKPAARN